MRIILAANDTTFIYNLRREILKGLIAEGHEVSVMCQVLQFKDELEQLGCDIVNIETARQGKNPFKDVLLFRKYYQSLKAESRLSLRSLIVVLYVSFEIDIEQVSENIVIETNCRGITLFVHHNTFHAVIYGGFSRRVC